MWVLMMAMYTAFRPETENWSGNTELAQATKKYSEWAG